MAKQSEILFAKWVAENDPFLFEIAKKRLALKKSAVAGMGFLDTIDWGSLASSVVSTVKDIAPQLVQYKAQSKILGVQLERAKQGLPPIEAANYAPTVKVAADITPEMEAAATRIAQQSIGTGIASFGQYIPMLAIGGAALYLITRKR